MGYTQHVEQAGSFPEAAYWGSGKMVAFRLTHGEPQNVGFDVLSAAIQGRKEDDQMNRMSIFATALLVTAAAVALITPAAEAQTKQRIYDAKGKFVGTVEQLPGGSQKQGIYDAEGVRIGTIEQAWPGSNKQVIVGPNGTVQQTIEPDPFGNSSDPFDNGGDPFASDGDGD